MTLELENIYNKYKHFRPVIVDEKFNELRSVIMRELFLAIENFVNQEKEKKEMTVEKECKIEKDIPEWEKKFDEKFVSRRVKTGEHGEIYDVCEMSLIIKQFISEQINKAVNEYDNKVFSNPLVVNDTVELTIIRNEALKKYTKEGE